MTNVNEIWVPVKDFEGYYEVSNLGRVRSVDRIDCNNRFRPGAIKAQCVHRGYYKVCIGKESKQYYKTVHKIVATAFVDGYFEGAQVNHKNGNKLDNRAENLEWVTVAENTQHAYDNGLATGPIGEINGSNKLSEAQVKQIRSLYVPGKFGYDKLSKMFGVHRITIARIITKKKWKHL